MTKAAGERPVGETIRNRLEWSFAIEQLDLRTLDLIEAIADAADWTDKTAGPWHDDPSRREAFKGVIVALINHLAVKGAASEGVATKHGSLASGIIGENPPSAEVSKFLVGMTLGDYERRTATDTWRIKFDKRGRQ